jgi:hypothetical protein
METQRKLSEAQRFVRALETDKKLRREALSIPRQHFLKLAEQHGYKLTGQELYDAMRGEWASAKVPCAREVDEGDDPDTCCCSTFSESPEF